MEIFQPEYDWAYLPGERKETKYIVIHHAAGKGSAEAIHAYHRDSRGWAGIAYHYYVRLDGQICRGREENWIGGHTSGYNSISLGVCFEGDFTVETMSKEQLMAGRELVALLRERYPEAEIVPHKALNSTACPGDNFPFEALVRGGEGMYATIADVPEYYRPAIKKLMEMGVLLGRRDFDPEKIEDNILDLSEDYCRVMATLYKLGVF